MSAVTLTEALEPFEEVLSNVSADSRSCIRSLLAHKAVPLPEYVPQYQRDGDN